MRLVAARAAARRALAARAARRARAPARTPARARARRRAAVARRPAGAMETNTELSRAKMLSDVVIIDFLIFVVKK